MTDARSRIPYTNQLCQLNLLGSHDTARFLTLVGEDPGLMRLALVLLFTYPGVPCIYYGDEIGMTGANDPYNRACFNWDPSRWNQDLRGWVQGLAALRAAHSALRRGGYRTLIAAGDVFGFARFDARETLIVAVNRSDAELETRPLALDALPSKPTPSTTLTGTGSISAHTGRMRLSAKSCLVLHAPEPDCQRRLRTHWRRWQATLCAAQIDPKRTSNSKEQRAAMRLYFRGTRPGRWAVKAFRVVQFLEIG